MIKLLHTHRIVVLVLALALAPSKSSAEQNFLCKQEFKWNPRNHSELAACILEGDVEKDCPPSKCTFENKQLETAKFQYNFCKFSHDPHAEARTVFIESMITVLPPGKDQMLLVRGRQEERLSAPTSLFHCHSKPELALNYIRPVCTSCLWLIFLYD